MPGVYIVECADGSYYVGSARSVEQRVQQHASGTGAEYTKRRGFKRLAWTQECSDIGEAYALEKQIQGWSRAKRQALIGGTFELLPGLSGSKYRRAANQGT